MKTFKRIIFYTLLLFTITTILFTVTGYHSRWDFSYQIVSMEEYITKLPVILGLILFMAILAAIQNNLGEKKQKERDTIYLKQMSERDQLKSGYDIHECRVCGHYSEKPTWGDDGVTPSFELCDCCGAQFGKNDVSQEIINEYRNKWISKGGKWFNTKNKPKTWSFEEQKSKFKKKNA